MKARLHRYLIPLLAVVLNAYVGAATGAVSAADRWVWTFDQERSGEGFVTRGAGWPLSWQGELSFGKSSRGGGLIFSGDESSPDSPVVDTLYLAQPLGARAGELPQQGFTVAAWVSIDTPQRWGGIIGCVEDNGDYERGWVLGYDSSQFTFGLSTPVRTRGEKKGNMTYVGSGASRYQVGRWHHVACSYDGTTCRIYVDGKLAVEDTTQAGDVLYDSQALFVIGGYRDSNEFHPHDGRILEVMLAAETLDAAAIAELYQRRASLTELPLWVDTEFGFRVDPFLTWPRTDGVSVNFETQHASNASLFVHPEDQPRHTLVVKSPKPSFIHNFRLEGLEPHRKYFYAIRAESTIANDEDPTSPFIVDSPQLSFLTASTPDRAYTFVVIGDTQAQPQVVKRVSDLAYMHRPNFVLHAGDLVTTGTDKSHWTEHFFPNMQPLIGRIPLAPVLGNHEQDAHHYYDYMDLPDPEYWYSFVYGNAECFMIDGNRSLAQSGKQFEWLDKTLAASKARWKFAVLHQPPYTSDSDDYGDTLKGPSQRGDTNAQSIIQLLEKHHVDICFSGHVHDYERTFPIREGAVTPYADGGVIYVTAAGGGGHLENFDPANTWFGHKKAQYHHLVYVAIHGDNLEFQAIHENGHLFDMFQLQKSDERRLRVDKVALPPHEHPHPGEPQDR